MSDIRNTIAFAFDANTSLLARITALEAENIRLRKALEAFDCAYEQWIRGDGTVFEPVVKQARAALEDKP